MGEFINTSLHSNGTDFWKSFWQSEGCCIYTLISPNGSSGRLIFRVMDGLDMVYITEYDTYGMLSKINYSVTKECGREIWQEYVDERGFKPLLDEKGNLVCRKSFGKSDDQNKRIYTPLDTSYGLRA